MAGVARGVDERVDTDEPAVRRQRGEREQRAAASVAPDFKCATPRTRALQDTHQELALVGREEALGGQRPFVARAVDALPVQCGDGGHRRR